MRRQSAVTTAALVVVAVVLAACDISIPSPDESAGPVETTPAAEPDPSSSGRESMEGRYDYNEMGDYVQVVTRDILNPWIRATWPGMPLPEVQYVRDGVRGPEGCIDYEGEAAEYTSQSYEYCDPDGTVYVGQRTLWEFYTETGDAGPAMGLAHEFGHHVQYELGVDPPATPAESVDYENQADCIAGTWARWADQQDILEDASESSNGRSDLDDIELLFPLIASAEDEPDRDHGTQQEREAAFYDGFNRGPAGCGLRAG